MVYFEVECSALYFDEQEIYLKYSPVQLGYSRERQVQELNLHLIATRVDIAVIGKPLASLIRCHSHSMSASEAHSCHLFNTL